MWLDDLFAPSGPHPASVYWVRRSALLLAVIIFFTVVFSLGGGHKKNPPTTGSNSPTTSTSPSLRATTPSTTTTGLAACDPQNLAVSADADSSSYAAGVLPHITLAVKNNGAACKLDTSQRYLTIMSGNDLWFSSKACPSGSTPTLNVGAGETVSSTYTWNRKRQATSCAIGAAAVPGTYLAQAHYSTLQSPGAVIRLS
jgi:hypothetical protein